MFTGIVSDVGTIRQVERRGDVRVRIATAFDVGTVDLGASISCSGVCLTVVDKGVGTDGAPNWFAVDVSGETLGRTAPRQWSEGRRLNLERAMRLGDELGGHIVTGHVDGIAEVERTTPEGDSVRIDFRLPRELAAFVAPKGSVTVDGVSLTVNGVEDLAGEDGHDGCRCGVNVIPHTRGATTLGELAPGSSVNIEIDVLARYLQRMEQLRGR